VPGVPSSLRENLMPRYPLTCPACQQTHDYQVRWADLATVTCVQCGAWPLEREPTAANFTIKGYAASTGYARKKP
jgi:putative FmdB family regulatory protein